MDNKFEKQPSFFRNQPWIPFISDFVTINLQSLLVTLLPIALVMINPSHLDLWVGAKIIEEFFGIEKILLIIISLKKNFITMSWVTIIAKKPKKGLIEQLSVDFFFNFN